MSPHTTQLQQAWQLHQAGHLDAAQQRYQAVIDADPACADAWVYLGIALFDRRAFVQSIAAYERAISLQPHNPVAWNNLGNSHRMQGDVDQAEACFEKSLQQKPGYLSALKNRGTLWIWNGEIHRGLKWYEQGLKVAPDNAELHRNLGVIYLLLQQFDRGWNEYRWRWRMPGMGRPPVPAPQWTGQPLQGKTILLYPEQGLGDAIQFVRSCALLKQRGATVLLQTSQRMLPLFTSAPGVDRFVLDTVAPPAVDFHASLLDVIDVTYQQEKRIAWGEDCFASDDSYLRVSDALVEYWRRWLDEHVPKPRIGIAWQGNPHYHADVYRSIRLETLRPLTTLRDVQIVNLQFGYGTEQLSECDFADSIVQLPHHVDTEGGAFTDTAAIVRNLDAVVTIDTAIGHLAAAVGTRVDVLLGKVPDWRWGLSGNTTPWYPTLRLHRQQTMGQWSDVVEEVTAELGTLLTA